MLQRSTPIESAAFGASGSALGSVVRGLAGGLAIAARHMSAGCRSTPLEPPSATAPATLTVFGAGGPLPPEQQRAALAAARSQGAGGLFDTHLRALQRSGDDLLLYRGNSARLLVDGPQAFEAMGRAVTAARRSILVQSYIVDGDGVAGQLFERLAERARAGVRVALIHDGFGSMSTDPALFERLAAAGVSVCAFNPLRPEQRQDNAPRLPITQRDHRKLMVVDGHTAFTGGINLSAVYGASSGGPRRGPGARPAQAGMASPGWRDTHVELRGPVADALARNFAQTWHGQACDAALALDALPAPAEVGDRVVTLLDNDPREPHNAIYQALLAAIGQSRQQVQITMAYFAPGRTLADALADAARRGVRVDVLLPGLTDVGLVQQAGRSYYTQLLEAGVRIYELENAVLHAKTAQIDGVWSTVGSSNLDWRSLAGNHELNVVVLGQDFGAQMQAMFEDDLRDARRITLEQWRQRPLGDRLQQGVGRLLQGFL